MKIIRVVVLFLLLLPSFVAIVFGEIVDQNTSNKGVESDVSKIENTGIQPDDPIRMFLISTDFSLLLNGYYSLIMERTIAKSKTVGIHGRIKDKPGSYGIEFFAIYLNFNIYSKKAFKGWWVAPHVGFKNYIDESIRLTANLNGGYKWELPQGFSLGFGFGPGISGSITKPETGDRINFDFVGGAFFGKAFGIIKGK